MISRKIRSYRIKNHFTQKEVANELGIKKSKVTAWESGLEEPTEQEIKKLSELFCVSPRVLRGLGNYKPIEIVKCNEDTKLLSTIFIICGCIFVIIGVSIVSTLILSSYSMTNRLVEDGEYNFIKEVFSNTSSSYLWTGITFILMSCIFFAVYYIIRHVRFTNRKKK